jgi:hypothetical protein
MSSDLKVLITKVAELRKGCIIQGIQIDELSNKLEQTSEYKAMQEARTIHSGLSGELDIAEEELKATVLAIYNKTGEKKPIDKVEVKIFKKPEYDPEKVLRWCRNLAPYLLILDKKGFEKKAEDFKIAGAPVEVNKEAKCIIASDLSVYLEKEKGE